MDWAEGEKDNVRNHSDSARLVRYPGPRSEWLKSKKGAHPLQPSLCEHKYRC